MIKKSYLSIIFFLITTSFLFLFPISGWSLNVTPNLLEPLPALSSVQIWNDLKSNSGEKYWNISGVTFLKQPEFNLHTPVNWAADPFNYRSWKWELNRFVWMDKLLADYKYSGDNSHMLQAVNFFLDWFDFNVMNDNNHEFRWKDDAVSFRATRLALVTNWALGQKENLVSEQDKIILLELSQLHIDKLLDVNEFMMNNHGLFQTRGLAVIATLLPILDGADKALNYATKRINELFLNQYGTENMHFENSPGYHLSIVSIFEKFLTATEFKEKAFIYDANDISEIKDNRKYLYHPNGQIALFGDTDISFDKKIRHKPGVKVFNETGYISIFSDGNQKEYLLMRAAFRSHFHRHSDDFSFEWSANDEVILTDAGKYSYEYKNPYRKYVTSTRAHNTVEIDNSNYPMWGDWNKFDLYQSAVRDIKDLKENNGWKVTTARYFDRFSTTFKRSISFYEGGLTVDDFLISNKTHTYTQWFHFAPKFELHSTDSGKILLKSEKNNILITPPDNAEILMIKGQKIPRYQGWISDSSRSVKENWAIGFKYNGRSTRIVTTFELI